MARKEEETNLVPFGDYTIEDAEADQESLEEDRNKDFIKIPEGSTRLRIIPPKPGEKALKVIYVHYIKVPGYENSFVVVCPRRTPNKDERKECPACKKAEALKNSGDPRDVSMGYSIEAKRRVHCNVIKKVLRQNKKTGEVKAVQKGDPKVWVFGVSIHNQLTALRRRKSDPVDFIHPLHGFDIIVERKGTGPKDTEYDIGIPGTGSSRLLPEIDAINNLIENQRDLNQYARLASDDDILAALAGEMPERKQIGSGSGKSSYKKRGNTIEDDDAIDAEYEDDEDF